LCNDPGVPRSLAEILSQADALADRLGTHEPERGDHDRVTPLLALRLAALKRAEAERDLMVAVGRARKADLSWKVIGEIVGTTGEAARQRYGFTEHQVVARRGRSSKASVGRETPS
jgi:hypothetical protein